MLKDGRVAPRLPAQDLERARRSYSENLGLEPSEERPGGLLYRAGSCEFALFLSAGASPGTSTQMGWGVDDIAFVQFVTLDGASQGPGSAEEDTSDGFARGGWLVPHIDEQFVRRASEWLDLADGLLLGRRTYEAFARDGRGSPIPMTRSPSG